MSANLLASRDQMSSQHRLCNDAFDRLGLPAPARALIIIRHSEPHRHYHTLRHIDLMLRQLPQDHAFAQEMMAATLFHDIVYDPTRSDNEDLSLSIFQSLADTFEADDDLDRPLVSAMILATKSHHFRDGGTIADEATNLLLKADLSILWHPDPKLYEWYARGVRNEYAFVPEDQFREARARILTTLRDDLLRSDRLDREETRALTRNTRWELRQYGPM